MNPDPDVGAEDPRARRDPKVVIALLVVLVVATAVISSLLRPDEVGRPPRQESPGRAAPPDTFTVDQADSDHVFVIRHSCGDSIEGCSQSLLSSADSGAHWTERAIPEQVSGPGKLVARLSALGECAVAVDGDAGYADDPTGEFRLHTADCGRSWSPVSLRVDRTVDVIPTDATLAPCRVERAADRCSHGVIVTLPHSGRRARLSTVPDWNPLVPERTPLPDGSWWLSGLNPDTGRWSLAVSTNSGRTWTERTLSGLPPAYVDVVRVTTFGDDMYATPNGGLAHRFGLVAVYHSTDGGQSWRKTWRADSGRAPERLIGTAIATRHGLFVTGMDAAGKVGWRSHDHGRTYRRPNPDDELGRAGRVRGGYLVTDDNTGRWYRSADGVSWEPLALPPAS